jgi:hypothetical protein
VIEDVGSRVQRARRVARSEQARRRAVTCAMVPLMQNRADSKPSRAAILSSKLSIRVPAPYTSCSMPCCSHQAAMAYISAGVRARWPGTTVSQRRMSSASVKMGSRDGLVTLHRAHGRGNRAPSPPLSPAPLRADGGNFVPTRAVYSSVLRSPDSPGLLIVCRPLLART